MSDEFVHIPLRDIEARVEAPDHLRDAMETKEQQPVRRVAPNPVPAPKNQITITLPPGIEYTPGLESAILSAVESYLTKNRDEILERMLKNIKVGK